jgi:hypothetical protein
MNALDSPLVSTKVSDESTLVTRRIDGLQKKTKPVASFF